MPAIKDKNYDFAVKTQSGLTDIAMLITAPNGDQVTYAADGTVTSVDSGGGSITNPITPTYSERGTSGIYDLSFTPTELGTYIIEITSATNSLNLDGAIRVADYELNDITGADYDKATDSLKHISDIRSDITEQGTVIGKVFIS